VGVAGHSGLDGVSKGVSISREEPENGTLLLEIQEDIEKETHL